MIKFNVKNTIFVSLILIIWCIYLQLIDTTVQIIIVGNLGQTEEVKGFILGLINILPIFLFPIFARFSDNSKTRIGRRAPFIIIGTILTMILIISAGIAANRGSFIGYAVFFILSYLGVSIYRPAATAILPDITPKPHRSKATAIKGIISAFGGLIVLLLVAIFGEENMLATYIISALFMGVILVLYILNINEPKLVKDAELAMAECLSKENIQSDPDNQIDSDLNSDKDNSPKGLKYVFAMPKKERLSLIFILLSVSFVTFGYAAMIATYQNYSVVVWGMTHNSATIFIVLIGIGGLVSTPIISKLSDTKGRKQTYILGIIIFIIGTALLIIFEDIVAMRYIAFVLFGSGWAFITILSFPMVLELSNTHNNGAFTSYFTLACTIPKGLTAYISGIMLTRIGYQILYPYMLIFLIIGFIAIIFAKHGNVVTENKEIVK